MKAQCTLILLLIVSLNSFAQKVKKKSVYHGEVRDTAFCVRHNLYHPESWSKALALKTGYMYSGYHSAEVGIEFMNLLGTYCDPYGTMGITVGNDFLFDKALVYGPKLSLEYHFMVLGTRLNATYYTPDFNSGSFKVRPEVGITLLGFANIFYGYTFNVSSPSLYHQKHSLNLFSNIAILKYYGQRRIKRRDRPKIYK